MSYTEIQAQRQRSPNYVPPVDEKRIGWLAFAERLPVDVCGTDEMRRGWLRALRDSANAEAGTTF